MNKYITPVELARLAHTTKRTIHFYDEKGVLKPTLINSKKYRFYTEKQVLDYQMILLLTTLGVSLNEIKTYSNKKDGLKILFNEKKSLIKQQISELQFNLNNIEMFLTNYDSNGTMVNPTIKVLDPFSVYYIEKIGPYSKIRDYCHELSDMLVSKNRLTTLAFFEDPSYQPKKSKIMIGALVDEGLVIKDEYKGIVKLVEFNPGKVISYTHHGSSSLLSLFWKELEKYCRLHHIEVQKGIPYFEIYRNVSHDLTQQFFEIYLPIK